MKLAILLCNGMLAVVLTATLSHAQDNSRFDTPDFATPAADRSVQSMSDQEKPPQDKSAAPSDLSRLDAMQSQIDKLATEIEKLKAENQLLKEKVGLGAVPTANTEVTKPASDIPVTKFELGPTEKVAGYAYATPLGWAVTTLKESKNAAMFKSPDKAGVILMQVKPRGGATPEMGQAYAEKVVAMLRQDFVKNKTEVIDAPKIVKDNRFFLKVQERFKVKDKVATQTHLYLPINKDMLEMTVITNSDSTETIAATLKLAEDILLSAKPEK